MKRIARRSAGFTLIELMIAVAVVAILAGMALPSYNEYVLRSHRANARAALLGAAQWMERTATARGRYPLTAAVPEGVLVVEGRRYAIAVVSTNGLDYTLTATPGAAQAADRCGAFRVNEMGTRTQQPHGAVATPLPASECWER